MKMKNIILLFLAIIIGNINLFSQNSLKIRLLDDLKVDSISYMKLYKFDSRNSCEQSKAVSIIFQGKLSNCFDYVRTFATKESRKIASLLFSPTSYGSEDLACFDTDYALLIFNKKKHAIGYVNISLICNKLISKPIIPAREYFSTSQLRKVGFSKKGKDQLIHLLNID